MKEFFVIYLVTQLISTAYGLTVISSVKKLPELERRLNEKGYVKQDNNSLYNFSTTITDVLKGFIPFYYGAKALALVNSKNPIRRVAKEEIEKGNYVKKEEKVLQDEFYDEETKTVDDSIFLGTRVQFEKPDKYVARKNDNNFYDTYETPVEYISKEVKNNEDLAITPFVSDYVDVQNVIVKEEITKKDIARAISELSSDELSRLGEKVIALSKIKSENKALTLEKEVA